MRMPMLLQSSLCSLLLVYINFSCLLRFYLKSFCACCHIKEIKLNFCFLQFESLVRKANLVQFFQYTNTYTIFAPKDTAYDNLTPDRKQIVDDLTATELETLLNFMSVSIVNELWEIYFKQLSFCHHMFVLAANRDVLLKLIFTTVMAPTTFVYDFYS